MIYTKFFLKEKNQKTGFDNVDRSSPVLDGKSKSYDMITKMRCESEKRF